MKNLKTTEDNYVWKIVNDNAKEIFNCGLFELFELRDDDSESLIENYNDLTKCLENGVDIGIAVGFIK